MNWHRSPAVSDRLAAAYALGTLQGPARRRFEAVMRTHPTLARQVAEWDVRLQPLAQRLTPLQPSEGLWDRIEHRAFGAPVSGATARTAASAPTPSARMPRTPGWRQWFAPVPAGALAFGLMLGLLPTLLPWVDRPPGLGEAQLPEAYVGVLANRDGKTGMLVSSRRHGTVLDLKQIAPLPLAPGQTLFVWTIDGQGSARPVGAVPNGPFVQVPLDRPAEQFFQAAVEVAVSIEPTGTQPMAPTTDFVYRGLCGKLWKAPPTGPTP